MSPPGSGIFAQTNCPEAGERARRIVSLLDELWLSRKQTQMFAIQHRLYLEQCRLQMFAKASSDPDQLFAGMSSILGCGCELAF